MAPDPELRAHREWIGLVQPVGLLVSPLALLAAQAHPNRNIVREQQALLHLVGLGDPKRDKPLPLDLHAFCLEVLGWEAGDLCGGADLAVPLPEYGDTLAPSFAVPDPGRPGSWLALLRQEPAGTDLDQDPPEGLRGWHASPQARLERLLREREVPIGVLANGAAVRLVYAPRGESSGHATFPVAAMCEVGGRPILAALHMLLSAERLFTLPEKQRLPHVLSESRKYQNQVTTALAEQILAALHELLRGFQAADEASHGELLREVLREAPKDVYGGLLATLLRLVFLLYAEDRGLMPADPVYLRHYSVTGLFEKLREDAGRYADTMNQRFGAWAQLLALFRLVHDGGAHGALRLPPRHGRLFDPDAYPFLEGRPHGSSRVIGELIAPPRVPDGVVWNVVRNLLVLGGERLAYRSLDVEQLGSVYEAMMGFELCVAAGRSIGVKPHHVVVDLEQLLAAPAAERAKLLKKWAACDVEGQALERLKGATTVEALVAALGHKVSPRTQGIVPAGAMYLQPTEERRRSGSHYTPRSLTEPIVATTLRPVLAALGERPRPSALLDLRICDPAMGSGAFLVCACRFLADKLVEAWQAHGETPPIPSDEDPVLHARRLVAPKCLYGVDKNPFAVDLAKLSLWLTTLARSHPFTFLDHALRQGDSLVGLGCEQIASFNWAPAEQVPTIRQIVSRAVSDATAARASLHALGDSDDTIEKRRLLHEADSALENARLAADAVVAAFFGAESRAERERLRQEHAEMVGRALAGGERIEVDLPLRPFHWRIELPEVFSRERPGFDAVVGNPPFAGKNTIAASSPGPYLPWLQAIHERSHGNADLVAHFFRRAFGLLREGGAFGLIATNTIAQGDTRGTGLRWICTHGGTIYEARKRLKWPGKAAVVVSVVHVAKGEAAQPVRLDGREAQRITAFLFHQGGHDDPAPLRANAGKSFIGSYVLGMGFTFDDTKEQATPIAEMHRLIAKDPRNAERIFPYLGGEEVNDSPTHAHHRYVINFGDMTEEEARQWPDLMAIVEAKVRGRRGAHSTAPWWQLERPRGDLYEAIRGLDRVLVIGRISEYGGLAFLPPGLVYSEDLVVFPVATYSSFAMLQSRVHDTWARFLRSSLEERPRYTPSDCFETFPFPPAWESSPVLEAAGRAYYEFRAALMVRNEEGLTSTYNRFHDPDERHPDIARLRELHAAMDRAVLDAYGWTDLQPVCEFLLDYEDEADEDEDTGRRSRRRKPWRLRWPDEVRDEVLARLLALNRERAEAERLAGAAAEQGPARPRGRRKGRPPDGRSGSLFR